MKLLLILLGVMTWTVESKNAVSGDGIWPYDIEVSYSNTYQKGQVRAADVAELTLGNLGGLTVEKIEVYVRSIQNGGAGRFDVIANGNGVASKEGTFKEWFGAYDNVNFHPLLLTEQPINSVSSLQISLTGTENSLYIEKYVIYWSPTEPHTVTLMRGRNVYDTMTEEHGMSGVALPKLNDEEVWKFAGWCRWEFWSASPDITIYKGGQKFYPDEDCSLWAVYRYDDSPEMVYQTELVTGTYVYMNSETNMAMTGAPENGRMESAAYNIANANQHYRVEFSEKGDSATIQHVKTGSYVGYKGTKLDSKPSKWCVFHKDDKTAFYMENNGKTYILWPDMLDETQGDYTGLMPIKNIDQTTTVLMPVDAQPQESSIRYTCHPESPQGLETVSGSADELIIPFGIYEIRIQNGKKSLRVSGLAD